MAAPRASFYFNANGLSVQFTDRSSGVVTSWSWDFGFKVANVEQTSTEQNPLQVFPEAGIYTVTLVAQNSEGQTSYQFSLVLSDKPTLNLTIFERVQAGVPSGIVADDVIFRDSLEKWQLYLQGAFSISDNDVFNEAKWPPLVNVLIAKLIIYDLVVKAANGAMLAFSTISQSFNQIAAQVTQGAISVADYSLALAGNFAYPVTVNLLIINGVSFGPSGPLANNNDFINYLNGLNKGIFTISSGTISSLGNANIITTFNYTHNAGAVNTNFIQSNVRIVSTTTAISTQSLSGSKGPLKSIKTGPAQAEWYDASVFWSNMFKTIGAGNKLGQGGTDSGIIGELKADICSISSRLGVQLSVCPQLPKDNQGISVVNTLSKPFQPFCWRRGRFP